ncbi:MAG: hypothetical protein DSY55_04935 [Clostridia bacterium]|nr:MAG: hypothetical protein DSY55_04935 [Clostridia bacterium]
MIRKPVDLGVFGEYLHYGMPLSLVTVLDENGRVNISTIASLTPMPGEPARIAMGILEENYSSKLVEKEGEFAVNFVTPDMRPIVRACGSYSGKDVNKIELCNLHPLPARHIAAPLLQECPLNIECRVSEVLKMDGLNLFVAEILEMVVDETLSDGHNGVLLEQLNPLFYAFGHTFARGPMIGRDAL